MAIAAATFSKMLERIASLFYPANLVAASVMLGNKVDFLLVTIVH